ncbi:MAG: HAD-IA family hydrolase [Candidatus Latescibacteria bacterium]|nr:HAD-IA family hydrolase [Candidatus Latescibacterota bacterium]
MLKGVIFDMDGTITVPYIDWKSLRERISAEPGNTILEYIESLPAERSAWANDQLLQAELEAASKADANDGIVEMVEELRFRGIKLAVVTNNHREAMELVLERYGLEFEVALSRDDGEIKPSGHLIEKALEALGVTADEAVVVGDGRYDVEASRRAGVRCIYLTHGNPAIEHTPAVETLQEAQALLLSDGFLECP